MSDPPKNKELIIKDKNTVIIESIQVYNNFIHFNNQINSPIISIFPSKNKKN